MFSVHGNWYEMVRKCLYIDILITYQICKMDMHYWLYLLIDGIYASFLNILNQWFKTCQKGLEITFPMQSAKIVKNGRESHFKCISDKILTIYWYWEYWFFTLLKSIIICINVGYNAVKSLSICIVKPKNKAIFAVFEMAK